VQISAIDGGHTEKGTDYGESGVRTYTEMKHGPDGALFLDPYFLRYLEDVQGKTFLDAGCGSGPWGILAAKNGAKVYGIDIQEDMIALAKESAYTEGVDSKTFFQTGDVGHLPYSDNYFDRAISINVGCNLPSLEKHIQELNRVMKKGGIAVVTAPASFGIVFTDGSRPVNDVISSLNDMSNISEIGKRDEVYRATFAKRNGKWELVLDESQLIPGEEIWRKIPKMMVPNRYHPEKEYLSVFNNHGFRVKQSDSPHFQSEKIREEYNSTHEKTLGPSYVKASPFVIFVIEKI
jgi:SAM-dependent methyltransferase